MEVERERFDEIAELGEIAEISGRGRAAAGLKESVSGPETPLLSSSVLNDILYRGAALANGDRGYEVKVVQTALGRIGFTQPGGVDGHFGPATRNAVIRFQRENGLVPTGIVDRESLLVIDRMLEESDLGDRTESLPAPRPLRGFFDTYLECGEEKAAYEAVKEGLAQIRDRTTTALEASSDDLLMVIDRLEPLSSAQYANVMRALAATREVNAWAPTLLDLLLALPASVSDSPELRERLCEQLIRKLSGQHGGVPNVLAHASPDSVGRLRGAPSFKHLVVRMG